MDRRHEYFGATAFPERTPLQQAEFDYNIAASNAEWWAKKKDREYAKYKKVLAEAGKCQCNVCPECGKEK